MLAVKAVMLFGGLVVLFSLIFRKVEGLWLNEDRIPMTKERREILIGYERRL